MTRVLIVGGGFGGLSAAKTLGDARHIDVTLLDRRNHHLFQPLLYQVATAGLSPAEIAQPIRGILSQFANVEVLEGEVTDVHLDQKEVVTDFGIFPYDYLILACGSLHSYFGHDQWEPFAPGLKTIEQATEIRRRILQSFEEAERTHDLQQRRVLLTFVVVGGGPTGVELAGAIGEMSRFTLSRDFKRIDSKLARVILVESGERVLSSFPRKLSARATRDLESLGVQVWTHSTVTGVDAGGVQIGNERVEAATVLWAAGVRAVGLSHALDVPLDRNGRVIVQPDLSLEGHPEVFVIGDQCRFDHQDSKPLPGLANVAMQQGRFAAHTIRREQEGRPRSKFHYVDKGQLATIGRSRAVAEIWKLQFGGFSAWMIWLFVHIYYLTGFKNRLFVVFQWAISYLTYRRGARLIVGPGWQITHPHKPDEPPQAAP
jgi:NADH:ubiquinone reductase (H+-translocating)